MFRIIICGVLATVTIVATVSLSIGQDRREITTQRERARTQMVHPPGDPKPLLYEAGATAPNSARLLTTGDETDGAWSLVELTEMPGTKTTWHRHPHTDQAYYVREGVFTVKVEDKIYQLHAGGYIFIPRGTPHGTGNVGSVPVNVLLIDGPAGFERYFQARPDLL